MRRFGMVCGIKPDRIEEYKKLHAAAWPEVLEMIKRCNLQNYSIFLKDEFLFAYFEYTGDDFESDMRNMGKDPATQRWWDVCKPCMNPLETRGEGEWWAEMEEIFHT
jgi:L-rhamnose mutarotase